MATDIGKEAIELIRDIQRQLSDRHGEPPRYAMNRILKQIKPFLDKADGKLSDFDRLKIIHVSVS